MTQPSRRKGAAPARGLASLIPTGPSDGPGGPRMGEPRADIVLGGGTQIDAVAVGADYREIPPSQIEPNPQQPRRVRRGSTGRTRSFDPRVRPDATDHRSADSQRACRRAPRYQLVMGERRWHCSITSRSH